MAERIAVVIATFGDRAKWMPLVQRASASVSAQLRPADYVIWSHEDTLQHARNWGAAQTQDADWFVFLDADDELDPLYLLAMERATQDIGPCICRPRTLGVVDGVEDDEAVFIPERNLDVANYIVIGAMVPALEFFTFGGFADYPMLEDWALWRTLVRAGIPVVDVPDAIYRIHVRENSRNTDEQLHREVYARIRQEIPL